MRVVPTTRLLPGLSTTHSSSSRKKKYNYTRIVYRRVLPCNLSPSSKNMLYVIHNTSQAIK